MSDSQTARENSTTFTAASTIPLPAVVPLVLVADPDAASRARRAEQMRGRGFRVALARTPFETIVKASCQLPDLILIDSALAADGPDATSALLATCPATAHIPIVRLTAGKRLPPRIARKARTA